MIFFTEPHSDTNPYLAPCYNDTRKFIVTLQHWFRAYRLQNYAKVSTECEEDTIGLMDRCIWSDFVFIKNALKTGIMTQSQFDNFILSRNDVLEDMPLPSVIVQLDVDPKVCYDRIHNMRQIDCESSITLEYLQGLEECYKEYLNDMEKKGVHIIRYNWNNFGNMESKTDEPNLISSTPNHYNSKKNSNSSEITGKILESVTLKLKSIEIN